MQPSAEAILDRYEHPLHRGPLATPPAVSASATNPRCGDEVHMYAEVSNGCVLRASFDGAGCTVSQAAADVAAELAEGHTLAEVLRLDLSDVLASLGPLRTRLDCAALGLLTLQRALVQLHA